MARARTPASRTLPRPDTYVLKQQLELALMVWAGFVAFVLVVILAVSVWRDIEISGWDQAKQVAQWYVLFIGVHVGWSILPLYITHGRTRREFMAQAVMFVVLFAAATAAMVTVTFVLEAGLYRLAGWPQEMGDEQIYSSASQLHLIFAQAWLLQALWTAGGLFIATAWYRHDGLGGLALTFAIVIAGVSGISLTSDWGPFGSVYEWLFGDNTIPGGIGVLIHLALIVLVLGLTWPIVRDVAIRNKSE